MKKKETSPAHEIVSAASPREAVTEMKSKFKLEEP